MTYVCAEEKCPHEEACSKADDDAEVHGARNGAELRDAGDYGKDDQAQHIVDDRGAQDDPGLRAAHRVEVFQDARGDAHARRAQRCADEKVKRKGRLGDQPEADSVSKQHGHHHADDRDEAGGGRDRAHLGERRFESHLEE